MLLANIFSLMAMLFVFSAPLSAKPLFVVITPEKTGTHLLTKALTLMTGMEVENHWDRTYDVKLFHSFLNACEKHKTYCQTHLFPNEEIINALKVRGYKIIFLIRDPRDQLVSTLFYIRDRQWTYGPLNMLKAFGKMSINDQITEMITGEVFGLCVPREMIGRRLPWMNLNPSVLHTVYYENLVGPEGDGSKEAQLSELAGISDFLRLKLSSRRIRGVADTIYGKPGEGTFNTGKIGSWKLYFNEAHKEKFKAIFGEELILLGYESDFNW